MKWSLHLRSELEDKRNNALTLHLIDNGHQSSATQELYAGTSRSSSAASRLTALDTDMVGQQFFVFLEF